MRRRIRFATIKGDNLKTARCFTVEHASTFPPFRRKSQKANARAQVSQCTLFALLRRLKIDKRTRDSSVRHQICLQLRAGDDHSIRHSALSRQVTVLPHLAKHIIENIKRFSLLKSETAHAFGCVDDPVVAALALNQGIPVIAVKPGPFSGSVWSAPRWIKPILTGLTACESATILRCLWGSDFVISGQAANRGRIHRDKIAAGRRKLPGLACAGRV